MRAKKIFRANGNQTTAGLAILIPDKVDFESKIVSKDMEGHYAMARRSIQQDYRTTVNMCAPNIQSTFLEFSLRVDCDITLSG